VTRPADPPSQFTLHVSVAQRWWLRHLPEAGRAEEFFRESVLPRNVWFIAADTLELDVLSAIAKDLATELDPLLAEQLATDVSLTLAQMRRAGTLRLAPHEPLLRAAIIAVSIYQLPLPDALAIALAQDSGQPLLLADRALYDYLLTLQPMHPGLSLAWLADQVDG